MTWVRYDDQASIHRKVAPLDDATYRLWREAIEWSSRNLTDGQIGVDELPEASKRGTRPRAAKLVERDLWHVAGHLCPSEKCPPSGRTGWVIHDYFDYQPSREKVRAEQQAKADRQRRWLDAKRGASRDASPDGSKDAAPSPPRPAPKGAGAGPPSDSPPPGSAGRPGGESGSTTSVSPKCRRCMNPLDSNFHQRVCAPSEAEGAHDPHR